MHNRTTKNISSQDKPASVAISKPLRILIAAGGTGGHVYPAIAIANALQDACSNADILFVGTKNHIEWDVVPRAGYDIVNVWISGFYRRFTLKNLLFPIKLITSLIQSMHIVSTFKPDVTIACGGYASGPVSWVAAKRKVPLFVQEQNSFPGITNRLLAKNAEKIFTAFKDADSYFPKGKTVLKGNPTRTTLTQVNKHTAYEHFGFTEDKQTLLILGGSGGAKAINKAMAKNIRYLHDKLGLQIIWQCGKRYYDDLHMNLSTDDYHQLRLIDFLHHMPEAYAAADLVVSRAGALSCSELALTGKPSILVPSPNVAGDHQTKNAQSMVVAGASELLKDMEAKTKLPLLVEQLVFNKERLHEMNKAALKLARPDAAKEIARDILILTKERQN